MKMFRKMFRTAWKSLHAPRASTFISISTYISATVIGLLAVSGIVPVMISSSIAVFSMISIGFIVLFGVVGAFSAWRGLWYIERVACAGLSGMGALLLGGGLVDIFSDVSVADYPVTASWLFGMVCWVVFGLTRFLRVREQPYAPGRGPIPLHVMEQSARQLLIDVEDARKRSLGESTLIMHPGGTTDD